MSTQTDWSTAPDGATHVHRLSGVFLKIKDSGMVQAWVGSSGAWISNGLHEENYPHDDLIPRHVVWTGEGLPPVGTVCELAPGLLGAGDKLRVVAHDEGGAVGRYLSGEMLGSYSHFIASELAPIRTPEQIAAEEREKDVDAVWRHYFQPITPGNHVESTREAIRLMLADGYRKHDAQQLHEQRLRRLAEIHGKMAGFTLEDFLLGSTEADSLKAEMAEILSHYRGPQA